MNLLGKIRVFFSSIEDRVNEALELEKSIESNKLGACSAFREFSPIISKLEKDKRSLEWYCGIEKSDTEARRCAVFMLENVASKLKNARDDYHKQIGDLRKSNISNEEKLDYLLKDGVVRSAFEAYKANERVEKSFGIVRENYCDGNIDEGMFIAAYGAYLEKSDRISKATKNQKEAKVAKVMGEFKEGKLRSGSGGKVTDRKQAIAIAMDEAGMSKADASEPTEAQKLAGNYKKEKRNVRGITVTLENLKGSVRSGKNADGTDWSIKMNNDYGYFNKTKGRDGDHIDVFLSDRPEEGNIYVIDQLKEDGETFDEHKVMMGYPTPEGAIKDYRSNYDFDIKHKGITEISEGDLKKWLGFNGKGMVKRNKAYSDLSKSIKGGDGFNEEIVPDDIFDGYEADNVEKAEYNGKEVDLNKPFRDSSGGKKFGVYVRNDKGNVVKVSFGDPNLSIKRDDSERRTSFRARHRCSDKKDITTPGYWSCKMWSSKPVSKMVKSEGGDTEKGGNKEHFSTEERKELAKEGRAMPDGSFPIRNVQDLKDAVRSYGRASDDRQAQVKKFIIKRAKALGAEADLPEDWVVKGVDLIVDALNKGDMALDDLEKGHKYIKREGSPGNYRYFYGDSKKKGKGGGAERFEPATVIKEKVLGRSGNKIIFTNTNPSQTVKGVVKYLKDEGVKFDYDRAVSTNSKYIKFESKDTGISYDIRVSDHSKPSIDPGLDKGIDIVIYRDGSMGVGIDTFVGYRSGDVKDIIKDIESFKGKYEGIVDKMSNKDLYDFPDSVDKKGFDGGDKYGVKEFILNEAVEKKKDSDSYDNYRKERSKKEEEEYFRKLKDKEKEAPAKEEAKKEAMDVGHGVVLDKKDLSVEFTNPDLFYKDMRDKKIPNKIIDIKRDLKSGFIKEDAAIEKVKGIIEKYYRIASRTLQKSEECHETIHVNSDNIDWFIKSIDEGVL